MERRGVELASLTEPPEAGGEGTVVPAPRSARSDAEPVLFWAERDPGVAFRGWALLTALALPAGLLAPDAVLAGAALAALVTWLNLKAFRLEVTPRALRFRPGLFGGRRSWPLTAVGAVEVHDEAMRPVRWGRDPPVTGHVLIELPDGLLGIPGLKDPQELARAIAVLRGAGSRPP